MRSISALAVLGALEFLSSPAAGSPPSPVTSSVPSCVLACPQGDIADTVVVRGIEGAPHDGYQVVMDFSQCAGFSLCPTQLPTPYVVLSPTQVAVTSASDGSAIFALQVKGVCAGGVRITAGGVLLTDGVIHPMSPLINADQDGDGVVTNADQQILAARAASDPLGDLNCDGAHNAADMAVLTAHMGHQCPSSAVPAHGTTWGSVRIRYR